jgi:hypothetical protein
MLPAARCKLPAASFRLTTDHWASAPHLAAVLAIGLKVGYC